VTAESGGDDPRRRRDPDGVDSEQANGPTVTTPLGSYLTRFGTRNVAGLIYGAIVCAATLAVISAHEDRAVLIVTAALVTLSIYYVVHVFTEVEADRFDHPDHTFGHALREAGQTELAVLIGGVPALAVFVVAVLLGVSPSGAVTIALWVTVGLLGVFGWLVGKSARATGWQLFLEVAVTVLAGTLLVVLKGLLH
jgi:hypothetical protein